MIFRSPYPDVPIPNQSLADFVLRDARRLATKRALLDASTGKEMTYGELAADVRRLAAGLAERGLRQGDVLAIYSPNCSDYIATTLAVASLGGILTTVNHLSTAEELARQLRDAGASLLLTHPAVIEPALAAVATTRVREVFVAGHAEGATPLADVRSDATVAPAVTIQPGDTALLAYSSGTTGLPKGVMITHRNWVANIVQANVPIPTTTTEIAYCLPPFFHIYGAFLWTKVLAGGGTVVFSPRFELTALLTSIQRDGITRAFLVPPVIVALANEPNLDGYDLSSLEWIMSAAAPLGAETGARCMARLGCELIQGYGLTETCAPTHIMPSRPGRSKPGSIGPLLPNTECRVVDLATGADLDAGESGELWIRGPQIMPGYHGRPDETAQMITADGWLRTGDLGLVDEDGDFHIHDRLKELIKYKAYQVAPAELEAVLLRHPAVVDAAVVPSPDVESGEVPKAFVVAKTEVTPEELMAFVAGQVAPYKKVRRIEFVTEIPKSASGKILRRVLVERERAALLVAR